MENILNNNKVNKNTISNNNINNKAIKNMEVENNLNGGGEYGEVGVIQDSVYTPDMNQRQFGCRQPHWDTKCTQL